MSGRKRLPLPPSTIHLPPRHVAPEVATPDDLDRHAEPLIWTVAGAVILFALVAVATVFARLLHR